jgi:DNA-binding transcriptional regulator of glucitol operon
MLKIDGHDNAIIGPAMVWREQGLCDALVYDAEQIRENLMGDGMTAEQAREFIEFNIEGAYVGEHTPVLVWPNDQWEEE